MLIVIPQLLAVDEVKALAGLAETARFSDGRASAGGYATVVPHEVMEVTRGVRVAVIGWHQSYVRDPAQRQILYDMNRARQKLRETGADDAALEVLVKCYGNLMRMWLDG